MLTKYTYYTVAALTIGALAMPLAATNPPKAAAPSNSIEKPATSNKKGANAGPVDTATAGTTTNTVAKPHLNREEILIHLKAIVKALPYASEDIAKRLHMVNEGERLSDEALTELISSVLNLADPMPTDSQEATEHYKALQAIESSLIKRLKSYRVSGFAWAVAPNIALGMNNQDPIFTVTYCNEKGEIKTRTYQASIDLIGINIEVSCRLSLIFFTNTDANFYNTNQPIELGKGIEVGGQIAMLAITSLDPEVARRSLMAHDEEYTPPLRLILSSLRLMYVPFKNVPGGLIILGTALLGLRPAEIPGCIPLEIGSFVTGGTLIPFNNQ